MEQHLVSCSREVSDNVINCKWIFKVKQQNDGSVERLKARLVANGMRQQEGIEYNETFSPVIKPVSIRVVLTIAISKGLRLNQIGISNAFLYGNLNERIIMGQPAGFVDPDKPGHVCLLNRVLYGLKQSPRMWFKRLKEFLKSIEFVGSQADPSLFILDKEYTVFLFVYVDDIVICGSTEEEVQRIIASLGKEFSIRNLDELKFFLGIQVQHTKEGGLNLNQQQYLVNLLQNCRMENLKPSPTPMIANESLVSEEEPKIKNSDALWVHFSTSY